MSLSESPVGGGTPSSRYCWGVRIRPGSNGYSMTDVGSHVDPCTVDGSNLRRMLCRIWFAFQWFGGPENFAMTAGSFQSIPALGFWCSCGKPRVWPISCRAVTRPQSVVRSHPKFMVG